MRSTACIPAAVVIAAAAGCETYRIEYHTRPTYYQSAAVPLNETVTLDDGTVLVFSSRVTPGDSTAGVGVSRRGDAGNAGGSGNRPAFQIRDELDDGTVVLRALLPQQVLANTLTCLRNQEYELIWDQLLAERTKHNYELREQGFEEFERFCASNRMELAATLTRMMLGLSRSDAFMKNVGEGVVRFYFHPRIAPEFKFKTVEVISEGGGLKLLIIR